MRSTDLRVDSVDLHFSDLTLATPLRLSKGAIYTITYARVMVHAHTRAGNRARGEAAILLSDVWSFPAPHLTHAQKDAVMRGLCQALAVWMPRDEWGDPLEKGMRMEEALAGLASQASAGQESAQPLDMPRLAMLNCLAPFDAAIHDAWGKALGMPVYAAYTDEHLNADLSAYLGPEFRQRFPADFLVAKRTALRVQHVVGVGDPISEADLPAPEDAKSEAKGYGKLPVHLAAWIRQDGLTCFKCKTAGQDPVVDGQRLVDVYRVAQETLAEMQRPVDAIRLSVDPNEACEDAKFLVEMLDWIAATAPHVLSALDYIEQPTPRDLSAYNFTLHAASQRMPVIIDESLDSLEILPLLAQQGWSGLCVKTCKGHTHSLLAYCWTQQHDFYVTLQDLTNVGLALVHSANLCAHLQLPVDYFECNQRQYLPHACPDERAAYPHVFRVADGRIELSGETRPGLYM